MNILLLCLLSFQSSGTIPPAREGLPAIETPDTAQAEPAVARQIERFQNAARAMQQQAGDQPGPLATAYGQLANVYAAYGIRLPAIAAYENAVGLQGDEFRWRYLYAVMLQDLTESDKAIEQFNEAAKLKSDYPALWVNLGNLIQAYNRYDEAATHYRKALELNPNSAAAYMGLGLINRQQRNYEAALGYYETALKLQPAANRIHYNLALIHRAMGNMDKAKVHIEQSGKIGAREADPLKDGLAQYLRGERAFLRKARTAYGAGDFAAAAEQYRLAAKANPENVTTRINLAATLAALNQPQQAVTAFEEVIKLEPENFTAHFNLGVMAMSVNQMEQAEFHLGKATQVRPNDGQALMEYAKVLYGRSKLDEAWTVYERAATIQPLDAQSEVRKADILTRQGKYAEALTVLREAVTRLPDQAPTADAYARMLAGAPDLSLRNGQEALNIAKQIFEAIPTAGHAETLAMAYAEVGDCAMAVKHQNDALAAAVQAGQTAMAQRMRQVLAKYQAGAPCRL